VAATDLSPRLCRPPRNSTGSLLGWVCCLPYWTCWMPAAAAARGELRPVHWGSSVTMPSCWCTWLTKVSLSLPDGPYATIIKPKPALMGHGWAYLTCMQLPPLGHLLAPSQHTTTTGLLDERGHACSCCQLGRGAFCASLLTSHPT